jgi:hypothetical protein
VAGNLTATGTLTILGGTSIGNFNVDATATCGNTYHTFIGTIGTVGGDECAALNVTQLDTNNNVIYRFGGAGQTWAGEFYANSSLVGMNTKGGLPLSFQIGQTEAMRIAANGNVGIGTSNPISKLHVYGAKTNPAPVNFSTTSIVTIGGESPTGFVLGIGQDNTTYSNTWMQSGYTGPLAVYTHILLQPLGGRVGIGTTTPGSQLTVSSGASIGSYGAAAPAEGLIVSGKVGIGTDNPFRGFSVAAPSGQVTAASFTTNDFIGTFSGSSLEVYFGATSGDTYAAIAAKSGGLMAWNNLVLQQAGGGVAIGTTDPGSYKLSVNGSAAKPGGGSWTDSSDERLKTDITRINGDDALAKILALKPVTFAWRNPDLHGGDQAPGGFIAQDLMQIFPEFVSTTTCAGADCALVGGSASSTAPTYNLTLPFKFFGYLVSAMQDIANLGPAFKNNLLAWLGDADNGINKLFAKEVHTDKLCVGNTCVTQEQFLVMVAASGASQPSVLSAPSVETPDATSTSEVSEDASSAETTPPESEASSTSPVVSSDASTSPIE